MVTKDTNNYITMSMEARSKRNKLLYIKEHLSCQNYMTIVNTGFKYIDFEKKTIFRELHANKNYLLFFLQGDFMIECNQFQDRKFHTGEMILIPRNASLKGVAAAGSIMLSLFFDKPESSCDKLVLQSLSVLCETIEYNFEPMKIRYPLTPFFEVLNHCITNGMNCAHYHELMQREFFFLLRGFYEKREIAALFYPIIGKEIDFKDFVIDNYAKVNNIEELIALSNLGRSRFFSKFNAVFGITAKQWVLKQKNQQILERMTEPGVYIKDVIEELGFDNQVYFTRYCKRHFGCTPKQLIERCQEDPVFPDNKFLPLVQNE